MCAKRADGTTVYFPNHTAHEGQFDLKQHVAEPAAGKGAAEEQDEADPAMALKAMLARLMMVKHMADAAGSKDQEQEAGGADEAAVVDKAAKHGQEKAVDEVAYSDCDSDGVVPMEEE